MNKNEICIYNIPDCCTFDDFSEEHVIPFCLGEFKNFPVLNNRVCGKCNSKIGELEEQLGRSGPEAFFRQYLNISGRKKHNKVNPFMRGSSGAKPIDFISYHPEINNLEVLWEFNPKKRTCREIRQIWIFDIRYI